jgi:hypothetical protein
MEVEETEAAAVAVKTAVAVEAIEMAAVMIMMAALTVTTVARTITTAATVMTICKDSGGSRY